MACQPLGSPLRPPGSKPRTTSPGGSPARAANAAPTRKSAQTAHFARIPVPTSVDEVAKTMGAEFKADAKGVDIDQAMKTFGPQIESAFNNYCSEPEGWKFEAFEDLKWKSKKIPKGEYKISLTVEGESLKT